MYAVYLCGCTDCFLSAVFIDGLDAERWAESNSSNPEGFLIKRWDSINDIDTSDTGWEQPVPIRPIQAT